MTRIPQLEEELVAAATRLHRPRRLVRPAARAALAAGAAVVAIVLAVVVAADNEADRRPQPAGAPPSAPNAKLSPEQEIERIGNRWAPLFAAAPNPAACAGWDPLHPDREVAAKYMAQPPCERAVCEGVGDRKIRNCTPLSPRFQRSFADATVQDVAIKGRSRAAARFSNGEVVELSRVTQVPAGTPPEPVAWLIVKLGGNAGRGFFAE